jgi:ribosomal protein S18 acetylase RimI-like enzyme
VHHIRLFQSADWPSLWPILSATFSLGDTYAFEPQITEAEAFEAWVKTPLRTYVAVSSEGSILGTYILKPNQPGLGSHICNCGYVVAPLARGQGIASAMCEHSQSQATSLGFRGMQFNLVVSTNIGAVRLWQKLGFRIIGTIPGGFRHQTLGYVDAHVMFKQLAV